jgi:catechol 2,3-dioxygenase-like lactoylglutathione lyase family enzyme
VRRPPSLLICGEIRVRDLERSERFYRALGLRRVAGGTMEDGSELAWMRDPVTRQAVELYRVSRRSHLYEAFRTARRHDTRLLFAVSDIAAAVRRLRRAGSRVTVDFVEAGVRIIFAEDPDGNLLELVGWVDTEARKRRLPPLSNLPVRAARRRPGGRGAKRA